MADTPIDDISQLGTAWWSPQYKDRRHLVVKAVCDRIVEAQSYRQDEFLRNVRLYGHSGIVGLSSTKYARRSTIMARGREHSRVSFNVVKSCSDAYVAKLTKDKIKTSFVTDGAKDQSLQDKAKELDRFVDGQKYEMDYYRLLPLLCLDTCVLKNGILKFYTAGRGRKRRIACERVMPTEMLVDDAEGLYGKPQNVYQEKYVDRLVALAKWGGKPGSPMYEEIKKASRVAQASADGYYSIADHIRIREAWHLPAPDGPGDDGYWVVCIDNATLAEGQWKRRVFPFAVLRRQDPLQGWWGSALADDLAGIQREISRILYNIQKHYHLLGASKVIVPIGYNKNKFDNDIDVLEANLQSGAPYIMCPTNIVAPEMYSHLDRLYAKAYELSGVNQMSAHSEIPSQVESGKAIQALADVESDRFMTNFRMAECFDLEVTRQILDLAEEISESDPDFGARAFDDKTSKRIVFKKNFLRQEEYVLKTYPTNLLAKDPSARMSQIEKLTNAGTISPDTGMRLLDFPDLSAETSAKFANYDATQRIVAHILERGEMTTPDPLMNLSESIDIMRRAYQETIGKTGIDEDRVAMLRDWITQAQEILTPPPPPPQMTKPPANMQEVQAAQAMQGAAAASQMNGAVPGGPASPPPQAPAPGPPPS